MESDLVTESSSLNNRLNNYMENQKSVIWATNESPELFCMSFIVLFLFVALRSAICGMIIHN